MLVRRKIIANMLHENFETISPFLYRCTPRGTYRGQNQKIPVPTRIVLAKSNRISIIPENQKYQIINKAIEIITLARRSIPLMFL